MDIFYIKLIFLIVLYNCLIINVKTASDNSNEKNCHNDNVTPIKYNGAQLWRVSYVDQNEKNIVAKIQELYESSMWNLYNGTSVDLFLRSSTIGEAKKFIDNENIKYEVIIDDIQQAIETENPPIEEIELLQNRKGHSLTWNAYHRFNNIIGYLDYLANTYPDLCSVQTIGMSVQNRPLKLLRISNGNTNNKAIWIDGGIHAREWISPATVTYIVDRLVEEWDEQPQFIQNIDWYVLAVSNPDGYEYTHTTDRLWRKNRAGAGRCMGVDLNRNYGYVWGGQGTSDQPCSEIYRGKAAFSEPETQAVKDFMAKSAAPFKSFLTFHSYGQYILYPWGYDKVVPPDHAELDSVGKEAANAIKKVDGKVYSVGPSGSLLYPAAGASDDWAYGQLGIKYSYTVELRDSGRYGFILPANQIEITGKETLELINVMAKAVAAL